MKKTVGLICFLLILGLTSFAQVNAKELLPMVSGLFESIDTQSDTAPVQVINLKAQSMGINTVKLTWNAVKDADGYIIYRKYGDGKFEYRYMVSGTSYTDTTAKTGEFNFYRVYAYKMVDGKRVLGPASEYQYAKPTPNAVSGLKAQSTGINSVKLTWNTVKDADGYIIYRKNGDGKFEYRYMVSGSSYTDTTAKTGEFNFYRVYAYKNVDGKRILSPAGDYQYAKPIPNAVSGLKAQSAGVTSVKLTWNAVKDADGYIIYRKNGDGKFEYRYMVSGLSYTDTAAITGEYNFYRVYAYKNVNGIRLLGSSDDYKYAKPIPNPVTNLSVSKNSSNGLTLQWSKVSGAEGYIVYHKEENEDKFTYMWMTSQNSYSDSPIYDNRYHFYRVYSYTTVGGKRVLSNSNEYVYGKAHESAIYNNSVPIQSITFDKSQLTMKVEDTGKLGVTITPYKTSQNKYLYWSSSNRDVAYVDWKGNITALKEGETDIIAETVNGKTASCKLTVIDPIRPGTSSGFSIGSWTSSDIIKHDSINSRNEDGSNTYKITFYTDGNEKWINQALTFEITDVTPTAYKNMYADMGIAQQKLTYQIASAADDLAYYKAYGYEPTVQEAFTQAGPGNNSVKARSGKIITVNAGMSTRAIKVIVKYNGKVLDTVYIASNGKNIEANSDGEREYSAKDIELYKRVRNKVEAELWKPNMTNLQKIEVVKSYINQTTHYPNQPIVTKEANPTFWKDWAVDDTILFYSISNDTILNRTMIFQGGITTCLAADALSTVAVEDMGLNYLYDKDTDVVADGEGVWIGQGSYSTNPTNPWHVTLWYKDAQNNETPLDAQGMGYSGELSPCEKHNCRDKIISLK